jgi:hypothetical protein
MMIIFPLLQEENNLYLGVFDMSKTTLRGLYSGSPAWPESHGFGLALNGSGFENLQAGPEPSMMAGFGSALA